MVVEYTGRQTEVPADVRAVCDRNLARLARMLRPLTRVHVTLRADKHQRRTAEVNVRSSRLEILATEVAADFATAVSTAFEKVAVQARRQVERRRARRRRTAAARPAAAVRTRRSLAVPEDRER